MTYTKRIVCLAKSKKLGDTCVAGVEWDGSARGSWIRPVGDRPSEAIFDDEMTFECGRQISLLDVVDIDFLEQRPHGCQVENHLIADDRCWRRVGALKPERLRQLAEDPPDLWGTENHQYIRAAVPTEEADLLTSSLMLVRIHSPRVDVKTWPERIAVRLDFHYNEIHYNMSATDKAFTQRFAAKGDGGYSLATETYACLSLSEPKDGYRYKLAAAVFEVE